MKKLSLLTLILGTAMTQEAHSLLDAPQLLHNDITTSVVLADLDGINGQDIISVSHGDTLVVTRNLGGNKFSDPERYSLENAVVTLTSADLDNQHGPDVITANYPDGSISVIFNEGNGVLASPINYSFSLGNPRLNQTSLTATDIDSRNGPDLIYFDTNSNAISFLFNQGDGSLSEPIIYTDSHQISSTTIEDLDGQNGPDLIYTTSAPTFVIRYNQGDGNFGEKMEYSLEFNPEEVTALDLDDANGVDLAIVGNSVLSTFLNNGDGTLTWTSSQTISVERGTYNENWFARKIDIDDKNGPDLIIANDRITTFLNDGDGNLNEATTLPMYNEETFIGHIFDDLYGIQTADIDMNNTEDLIIASDRGIRAILGKGDGAFQFGKTHGEFLGAPLISADLDNKNGDDLVTVNDSAFTYLNNGDAHFSTPISYTLPDIGHIKNIFSLELDGANGLDLIFVSSNKYAVLLNNGDGSFSAPIEKSIGDDPSYSTLLADLDQSQGLDLISLSPNHISFLTNTNGDFVVQTQANDFPDNSNLVATGDFDNNNGIDLIVTEGPLFNANLSIRYNNGNNTFSPPTPLGISSSGITISDVNRDNYPDLISLQFYRDINTPNIGLSVLINKGDGTFNNPDTYGDTDGRSPPRAHPYPAIGGTLVKTADMDGIHGPDIIVSNYQTGAISILLNNGHGSFEEQIDFSNSNDPTGPAALTVADLDNMNGPDILAYDYYGTYSLLNTIDTSPDPFFFTDYYDVDPFSWRTGVHGEVVVSGLNQETTIEIENGEYVIHIPGGNFTSEPGIVNNGDIVTIWVANPFQYDTVVNTTLTIGNVSDTLTITTIKDPEPDPFEFPSESGVGFGEEIISEPVEIQGLGTTVDVSIDNGMYSINNSEFTSEKGTVSNGDSIRIKLTSADDYFTETTATLFVGKGEGSFTVHTVADYEPDPFQFIDLVNVPLNTAIDSNVITIEGVSANERFKISVPATIHTDPPTSAIELNVIRNGEELEIGNIQSFLVKSGDKIQLKLNSAPTFNTNTSATLTVGGVSSTFSIITKLDNIPDEFQPGDITNAPINETIQSEPFSIKGLETDTSIEVIGGEYSLNGGNFTSETGTISQNDEIQVRTTSASDYKTMTQVIVTIGGVEGTFNITTESEPVSDEEIDSGGGAIGLWLLSLLPLLRYRVHT